MSIQNNLEIVYQKIERAKERGGLNHPVQLIAVTKTHPFSVIEECYSLGIRTIGENKIQEASNKFESFDHMPNITKRFIGHLQSNKINKCIKMFDAIDSIDTIKLARKIDSKEKQIDALLEVNTSGEPQKQGFDSKKIEDMIEATTTNYISIKGLMTIGPHTYDKKEIRNAFIQLRRIKEEINKHLKPTNKLTELSMGMSGDYEIAVEEGSTMVRIGSALFGRRHYK